MQRDKRALMLETLTSNQYKKRLEKVRCFEKVSGGGIRKKIQHLLAAPSIYLPYLFYAKAGMYRWFLATATLFWGRKIQIPLRDYDALILYMYGGLHGDELKLTKYLIKNLGHHDVFYDVGANFGFYTYLATDLCKETHAFEPMPWLASVIRGNVRKNDTVAVNAAALSDKSGTIDFYITDSTMVSTINASVVELYSSLHTHTFKKISVPTMTLDDYVAMHAKPTFIKIDAEGAEEQIIKGGPDFLSSSTPVIAMEIWGKGNKWELSMSAAERLRGMGYQSYQLDNEGTIQKVEGDLSKMVSLTGGEDFIFKK
jgi:FkbM family methyltransferase